MKWMIRRSFTDFGNNNEKYFNRCGSRDNYEKILLPDFSVCLFPFQDDHKITFLLLQLIAQEGKRRNNTNICP